MIGCVLYQRVVIAVGKRQAAVDSQTLAISQYLVFPDSIIVRIIQKNAMALEGIRIIVVGQVIAHVDTGSRPQLDAVGLVLYLVPFNVDDRLRWLRASDTLYQDTYGQRTRIDTTAKGGWAGD